MATRHQIDAIRLIALGGHQCRAEGQIADAIARDQRARRNTIWFVIINFDASNLRRRRPFGIVGEVMNIVMRDTTPGEAGDADPDPDWEAVYFDRMYNWIDRVAHNNAANAATLRDFGLDREVAQHDVVCLSERVGNKAAAIDHHGIRAIALCGAEAGVVE